MDVQCRLSTISVRSARHLSQLSPLPSMGQ